MVEKKGVGRGRTEVEGRKNGEEKYRGMRERDSGVGRWRREREQWRRKMRREERGWEDREGKTDRGVGNSRGGERTVEWEDEKRGGRVDSMVV